MSIAKISIQWPLSFSSFKLYFYHMYETPEKTIGMIIETNVTCHLITLSIISNLSFLFSLIVPLFFVQFSDCCLIGCLLSLACPFALEFTFSSADESCWNSCFYFAKKAIKFSPLCFRFLNSFGLIRLMNEV